MQPGNVKQFLQLSKNPEPEMSTSQKTDIIPLPSVFFPAYSSPRDWNYTILCLSWPNLSPNYLPAHTLTHKPASLFTNPIHNDQFLSLWFSPHCSAPPPPISSCPFKKEESTRKCRNTFLDKILFWSRQAGSYYPSVVIFMCMIRNNS